MCILGAFIFILLQTFSLAIDEDSAKESPCFNIADAINPDAKWFSSVAKWYCVLSSRLDLYRTVHDILETDYKNIPEYSVYYDSCLEWDIGSKGFTGYGYNGRKRFLEITQADSGMTNFEYKSEWSQGMAGRAFTTLTDNKTFVFIAGCFSDNQMTWNVFAAQKTLNKATKQKIFEHAKSLGFNPDFFVETRSDSCKGNHDAPDIGKGGNVHSTAVKSPPGSFKPGNSGSRNTHETKANAPVSKSTGHGHRLAKNDSMACDVCRKTCPGLFVKSGFRN